MLPLSVSFVCDFRAALGHFRTQYLSISGIHMQALPLTHMKHFWQTNLLHYPFFCVLITRQLRPLFCHWKRVRTAFELGLQKTQESRLRSSLSAGAIHKFKIQDFPWRVLLLVVFVPGSVRFRTAIKGIFGLFLRPGPINKCGSR